MSALAIICSSASILMGCGGEGSSPSTAAGTGRYPSFAEAVGGGAKAPGSATDAPETPVRAPEPGGVQVDPKPTIAFIKDGHSVELDCKESGTVTTHTGKYIYNDCGLTPEPLNAGGPQVDRGRVGLWLSESNPYWWAFDIGAFGHQDPNTSSNPSNVFVESEHRVSVNGGEPMTVRVAPASIKTLDNGTPVELTPARVRAAVEAHLLPRVDAGVYARYGMKFVAPTVDRVDYDPARIYSYDGRKSPFGDTSSTGGENYHGRAVMSEWDANLIRLALEDESVAFKKAADAYLNQMRWARSMPFETIQSRYGPHIRDPQKVVDPRDKPYVTAGRNEGVVIYNSGAEWQRPDDYPFYGSTSSSTRKHTRDLEHAHNMGEVWFAATGDPRAAMHLLARATWALSYPWEGWKSGDYTTMISPYVSERATLNFLRDTVLFTDILADTVKVDGKTPLWPKSRMESVRDETWKSWVKWRDERLAGDDQKSKMVRYFGDVDWGGTSPFMMHKYGLQVAYRLADRGYPELMEQFARGWMFRFGEVGATAGYYPKTAGGFEVEFPPANVWTSTKNAMDWWQANTGSDFWPRRETWDGAEGAIVTLTAEGFEMLQDLVDRGKLDPVPGLDDAAAKNLATVKRAKNIGQGQNDARFAVVPWTDVQR